VKLPGQQAKLPGLSAKIARSVGRVGLMGKRKGGMPSGHRSRAPAAEIDLFASRLTPAPQGM
ncbi:MAG: hypothetical protein WAW88_09570, partial [Nocardioides sp.]